MAWLSDTISLSFASVMFSFVTHFFENIGLIVFQNVLLSVILEVSKFSKYAFFPSEVSSYKDFFAYYMPVCFPQSFVLKTYFLI